MPQSATLPTACLGSALEKLLLMHARPSACDHTNAFCMCDQGMHARPDAFARPYVQCGIDTCHKGSTGAICVRESKCAKEEPEGINGCTRGDEWVQQRSQRGSKGATRSQWDHAYCVRGQSWRPMHRLAHLTVPPMRHLAHLTVPLHQRLSALIQHAQRHKNIQEAQRHKQTSGQG